jgi:hypothetical protein
MRLFTDIACRRSTGTPLLAGARASLGFFAEACRRGIPPRQYTVFGAPTGPAVRIYTDAMYEEGKPSGLGIVAFFPA